jgi:hypothetical protein
VPSSNLWRTPELAGPEKALADQLRAVRLTLSLKNASGTALLDLVRRIGGVEHTVEDPAKAALAAVRATLSVQDLPCGRVVELVTLPYGLDARLDGGKLVLFHEISTKVFLRGTVSQSTVLPGPVIIDRISAVLEIAGQGEGKLFEQGDALSPGLPEWVLGELKPSSVVLVNGDQRVEIALRKK